MESLRFFFIGSLLSQQQTHFPEIDPMSKEM
jgi:hypothetical protein